MKEKGIGGYLYLAFIGLALALLGGLFVFILGRGYLRAKETREWPTHAAVIMVSAIGERNLGKDIPTEYTHELVYEYQVDEKFYRAERVKRRANPYFKEEAKIAPAVARWPVGKQVEAFVNPRDPSEVVLDHETKAPGYSIWFPGLFLVGGAVVFGKALVKMVLRDRR
ncbi:MAG: hypothetical protein ACJAVK_003105 [Akkermansiaceae bacterium]